LSGTFDFSTEILPRVVKLSAPLSEFGVANLFKEGRIVGPVGRVPVLELGPFALETVLDKLSQIGVGRKARGDVHEPLELEQDQVGMEAQLLVDERLRVLKQARHLDGVQQRPVAVNGTVGAKPRSFKSGFIQRRFQNGFSRRDVCLEANFKPGSRRSAVQHSTGELESLTMS